MFNRSAQEEKTLLMNISKEDKQMKKMIAITAAAVLIVCISASGATAGAARRHTIEGVMIGTGIAILGAAIYNEIHDDDRTVHVVHHGDRHPPRRVCQPPAPRNRYAYKKHHRGARGHWVIKKVWVGPKYEKRWHPGHYNHRGAWKSGRHKKFLVKEGYYKKEKVWVRD